MKRLMTLAFSYVVMMSMVLSAAPTSQPVIMKGRSPNLPKPVYMQNTAVSTDDYYLTLPGTLYFFVDGGGRYDAEPNTPGWQEDSYWVGGYYGPREVIDFTKLKAALARLPSGAVYNIDDELRTLDLRTATDDQIETQIRRFRGVFKAMKQARPDIIYGIYSEVPRGDYWTPTNYGMAYTYWEKYQRLGISKMTETDRWWLSNLANNSVDYNRYVWDTTKPTQQYMANWRRANDRLAFGRTTTGRVDTAAGMVDAIDALHPSLYDFYVGDDAEMHIKYQMSEAKRIAAGRLVIPYFWPDYHDSNMDVGNTPIPIPEWRQQLRWAFENGADGAILWNAYQPRYRQHVQVALEEAWRATNPAASDNKP